MRKFVRAHRWAILLLTFVLAHVVGALVIGPLHIASLTIIEACVFSWLFVLGYASVRGWWSSSGGIQLMSLGIFVALLTSASLLPPSLGFDGALRRWVVFAILLGMSTMMLNLAKMLIKAQWRRWPHRGTPHYVGRSDGTGSHG